MLGVVVANGIELSPDHVADLHFGPVLVVVVADDVEFGPELVVVAVVVEFGPEVLIFAFVFEHDRLIFCS